MSIRHCLKFAILWMGLAASASAQTVSFTFDDGPTLDQTPLMIRVAVLQRHSPDPASSRQPSSDLRTWRPSLAGDTAVGMLIVCGDEIVGEGVERTPATRELSALPKWTGGRASPPWSMACRRDRPARAHPPCHPCLPYREGWPQAPELTGGVLADECLEALRRTKVLGQTS